MPVVQALPGILSGRAFVKLRNHFRKPVFVKGVFLATAAGGPLKPLLDEPKELAAGETERVDITEKLLALFSQQIWEAQRKRVAIMLSLEPEPPNQPGPSYYRLVFENGRLTEFSGS